MRSVRVESSLMSSPHARSKHQRRFATAAATTLLMGAAGGYASVCQASDFEVTGDVIAQGYEVASPFGDVFVGRQRLTAMVGLAAYNLQGDYLPGAADYSVRLRMRVDADFGVDGAEERFDASNPSRYLPGLSRSPVDVMYGYVEGRNLADGWFGFRVGRQYVNDVLGWWSFDGAMARVTTPFYVQAEVYGGLEQRGGLPLSTPRYERQGVWRGSRGGQNANQPLYPSFQFGSQAPAFGVALESDGPSWIHGRFDYRRVYNTGDAFTSQFPAPGGGGLERVSGMRLSSERLGYALSAFLPKLGGLKGGFVYDLHNGLISRAYGGLHVHIGPRVTASADVDYFVPTFDADSIWNWFAHNGSTTALGRVSIRPSDKLDVDASGGVRLWATDGDPDTWAVSQCTAVAGNNQQNIDNCLRNGLDPSTGSDALFSRKKDNRGTSLAPDLLLNLGGRYRWSGGHVGVSGMLQTGFGGEAQNRGRRIGGGANIRQALVPDLFWLSGRASLYNWSDPLRPDRDATSFGYVVTPEVRPVKALSLRADWEHNMNRLVGQRFRVIGYVTTRISL